VVVSQIAGLIREYEAVSAAAGELCGSLTADQLAWRPGPDRWSIGENIEHLSASTRAFLPGIDAGLKEARGGARSAGPYRMDSIGRLLRWSMEPPPRMKMKTTGAFRLVEFDPATVLHEFLELQGDLIARLQQADGWAIDRVKVASPFSNRVRYNLYSAFVVIVAHQRRHCWQASQVKQVLPAIGAPPEA
jgi:hypothetical protein